MYGKLRVFVAGFNLHHQNKLEFDRTINANISGPLYLSSIIYQKGASRVTLAG